jgi:hypothetical protein
MVRVRVRVPGGVAAVRVRGVGVRGVGRVRVRGVGVGGKQRLGSACPRFFGEGLRLTLAADRT